MLEPHSRNNPGGRHGGDLRGMINHLRYISDMGFTALWLNPVQINDMPKYSYHGYAITDHYRIDPRLGSMDDYTELVSRCHASGIRVIMDLIFNHCGTEHWFIKDPPSKDWVHYPDTFIRTNYRSSAITDPHASQYDRDQMLRGWFDELMPDINQNNPFLERYLTQNTLWWIENTGIDGIRMDTQPYPYKEMMSRWAARVRDEYPWFSIVGETWMDEPSMAGYYQETSRNFDGYNSKIPYITDFPLHKALRDGLNEKEGWSTGMGRIYNALAQDFLYFDPYKNLIFADNHDVTRVFSSMGEDIDRWKMAMAFILTCRGIPAIYYGTELLMTGSDNYESFRADFPGGWPGDTVNAFIDKGLTPMQL
jgi:glycosidase